MRAERALRAALEARRALIFVCSREMCCTRRPMQLLQAPDELDCGTSMPSYEFRSGLAFDLQERHLSRFALPITCSRVPLSCLGIPPFCSPCVLLSCLNDAS